MKLDALARPMVFFALSAVIAWAALFSNVWPLVVVGGFAAGMLAGGRYATVFVSGVSAGALAAFVWMSVLLTPGSGTYIGDIGALASMPGYMLVFLSFAFTALYVGCGGVLGTWARKMAEPHVRLP